MTAPLNPSTQPEIRLGVWDTVSVIVGIVVGVSIFKAPQSVFGSVAGPWQGLGVWVLGGVLTFIGALCYAELATTYPRLGGDYVYLTRAFGGTVGFVFGWVRLVAIVTGNVGAMSFVFADYAGQIWNFDPALGVWLAVCVVLGLSLLNMFGLQLTVNTQNVLTVVKSVGVLGIIIVGLAWGGNPAATDAVEPSALSLGTALIFVLYTYGGWNDSVFVAAEVRDVRRNMPRALLLGTLGITVIYLLVNGAYLWCLGFDGVRSSPTPASDVLHTVFGERSARGMSLLVMVSALGAVNGMIFTGSRVSAGMGADHRLFALMGRWHPKLGSPIWSLGVQAIVSVSMILIVGTEQGRRLIDRSLAAARVPKIPWDDYGAGFETLVAGTAPVFWLFLLLTATSLFVLRVRDADLQRPFAVPLYPLIPIIFCLTCGYMLYASLAYAKGLAVLGIVPLVCGIPLHALSRRMAEP